MVRLLRFQWRPNRECGTADLDDDPVEANSVRPEVHLVIEGGSEENLEIEDSAFTGQKKFRTREKEKMKRFLASLFTAIVYFLCSPASAQSKPPLRLLQTILCRTSKRVISTILLSISQASAVSNGRSQ